MAIIGLCVSPARLESFENVAVWPIPPSPIAWSILEGDSEVGNTTMLVDEGLDSGPILLQDAFALSADTTRGDLDTLYPACVAMYTDPKPPSAIFA